MKVLERTMSTPIAGIVAPFQSHHEGVGTGYVEICGIGRTFFQSHHEGVGTTNINGLLIWF